MPTLRHALKYVPAAAIVVLVVLWLASWHFYYIGVYTPTHYGTFNIRPADGWWLEDGSLFIAWKHEAPRGVRIPITWLATGLLPLAIGSFIGFRFRIWHYLVYTALIAVELAHYRWLEMYVRPWW